MQNTTPPAGLRGVTLTNVQLWNGTGGALWARSVIDLTVQGGRFRGGANGGPGQGNVFLRGTAAVPSESISMNARVEGLLSLSFTETSNFDVVVDDFYAAGNVRYIFVKGISMAPLPTNWLARDSRRDLAPWPRR